MVPSFAGSLWVLLDSYELIQYQMFKAHTEADWSDWLAWFTTR